VLQVEDQLAVVEHHQLDARMFPEFVDQELLFLPDQ
jgi:hypothetical protein